MAIVKDDFSGPRVSSTFFLGSLIFIKAMVAQQSHMPLELFLEECVAANSANLSASNQTYPIISNYGCFVDGQVSSSKFLHSANLWELHLQVQAFKFTDADVYIHCGLVAWDPQGPNDPTKKVCNFNQDTKRWEYLDMSSQNSLCSCCNTNCQQRKRREAGNVFTQLICSKLVAILSLACTPWGLGYRSTPSTNLPTN
ncbi:ZP3 protein, partial [Amia calva]|nr:ZP3 protein [Amia calva]